MTSLVVRWDERGRAALLIFGKLFAQPRHGSVEMMQTQFRRAVDGIVLFPFFGGPVAARRKQAVQDSEEDRPLERELKVPLAQQSQQDFVDRTGLSEPLKNEGRANPGGAGGDGLTAGLGSEHGEFLGEPAEGVQEGIEAAAGQ